MKKSLSILLALLMILSSLPVMAFTASAEQADPNLFANYTYANWQTRRWGRTEAGTESLNGGTSIYIKSMNYQKAFTTVVLEPNTTYLLDFNWKADTNESGHGINPSSFYVFPESAYGSNEALLAPAPGSALESYPGSGSWHHDNGDFFPAGKSGTLMSLGADLESITNDTTSRKNATAGTWQHFATKFTTNSSETNYAIMMDFVANSTGNAGPNAVTFSDFRLIKTSDSEKIAIEDKCANDWFIPANARIFDDASYTKDGITSDYRLERPVWQKFSTTVTLDPNTQYAFSFDYNSQAYELTHYIQHVQIFSAETGSVLDAANWSNEAYNKDKIGLVDSFECGSYKPGEWQHVKVPFTTTESTTYNIIIYGTGSGFNNAQTIYLANFKIDGLVAKKPGNLLNNATHAKGDVTWTTTTDVDNRIGDIGAWGSSYQDNPDYSYNGGYAWTFGFGDGKVGGDNAYTEAKYKETYAYVYINAKGLKAGKNYDFSFIYRKGFYFTIDSIKSGANSATYVVAPTDVMLPEGTGEKTSAMFNVPADGDYVITLKSNRACMRNGYNTWSATYLSDLELYERGAMYTVAVATEGNGSASASQTGYVEGGNVVTFTAKAELYEKFLGWYVGDTLVSEELTYAHTVDANVTVVAKFTAKSENLMADYNTGNFVTRYWGSVMEGTSHFGGNAIRANNSPHQSLVTKVNLEAGKEYTFTFETRSIENVSNKEYVHAIQVRKILTPDIDILGDKNSTWIDGQGYVGNLGEDIESATIATYVTQEQANTCEWQTVTTGFTPTESGEYAIIMELRHETLSQAEVDAIKANSPEGIVNISGWGTHANNNQSVDFSDFVLKEIPGFTGTKYEWRGVRWSKISSSNDSYNGGYAYRVDDAMNQNVNTTLNLKPGTTYNYSFSWKALDNEKGLAYVSGSSIYSANSGSPVLPGANESDPNWGSACNYEYESWGDYTPIYIPNDGYKNLMITKSNPNSDNTAEDSAITSWNTYEGTFTTTEDEDYYLFINFGLKGSNSKQAVILSDFNIEEVVVGAAPAGDDMIAHPGVSIRKASESNYGQALRYKFTIDGGVIANAQADGYELVEYGTVVTLAEELKGHAADPILGATTYATKKGIAYNKDDGTNVQFAVDGEGNVTYTAALYNIPTNKYDAECVVRPYAIFRNANGDTYVRYGTTRTASVFAVAKAVLDGNNTDDQNYVNNTLLAGNLMDAYNAWLAK